MHNYSYDIINHNNCTQTNKSINRC